MLHSVFGPVCLQQNCVKTNNDTHILSAAEYSLGILVPDHLGFMRIFVEFSGKGESNDSGGFNRTVSVTKGSVTLVDNNRADIFLRNVRLSHENDGGIARFPCDSNGFLVFCMALCSKLAVCQSLSAC